MEQTTKDNPNPKGISNELATSFVKMGNALLPLMAKKKEDKAKQLSFLNYLATDLRNSFISKQGQSSVNHADIWNWKDLKDKSEK